MAALGCAGPIKAVTINPITRYAFVEFESVAHRETALATSYDNLVLKPATVPRLTDERKRKPNDAAAAAKVRREKVHAAITTVRQSNGGFIEQLRALVETRRAGLAARADGIDRALTDCAAVVTSALGVGADLIPFGSVVTGTGAGDNDVDVTVFRSGSSRELTAAEAREKLHLKLRSSAAFSWLVQIPAKCPVIRAVHLASGTRLDVSIDNVLAVRNTELVSE